MNDQDTRQIDSPQVTKDNRADYFRDIAEFAKSEINFVRTAYKWLISLVAVVAIAGIAFAYTSISDFKKDAREEVKRRIDEEFNKQTIHKMVVDKAKERIDEIADTLIEKQIANKVSPQIKLAQEALDKIQANFMIAEDNIKMLKKRNEIAQLADKGIIEASTDSYEELERIKETAESADIKAAADAEICRIKSFYASITRLAREKLSQGHKWREKKGIRFHHS